MLFIYKGLPPIVFLKVRSFRTENERNKRKCLENVAVFFVGCLERV